MANNEPRTTNHGLIPYPMVILCGGLGLRLRPAIQDKPKCLAPIRGRPFLEWLLANLRYQGFTKVILCLGYGSDQVVEFIGNENFSPLEISHIIEKQPLGTAGALRNAVPLIHEDQFLAMNGDTMLEVSLKELLLSHMQRNALATVALWRNPECVARYGGVDIDAEGRIVRFSEKGQTPKESSCQAPPFINGGVYAFAKEMLEKIPGPPSSVSLERDVFPSIVGRRFYGLPCTGYFVDIGIPEDYQKAQTELPRRFTPWS